MTAIAGLIYAGGESRRFGADKAIALLQDKCLINHVADRLEPQVSALAVAGTATLNERPSLDDGEHVGKGPLAGLLAGLTWASDLPDVTWLITAPCDVPLLPKNLVALLAQNQTERPRVLNVDGRWQPGCALWPLSAAGTIESTLLSEQDLSLRGMLCRLDAAVVDVLPDELDGSFININTQDALTQLEQRQRRSHG